MHVHILVSFFYLLMLGADSKSPWYPWSWSRSGERIGFRALGKLPTDGACWGDGGGYKRNVALKIILGFFYVGDLGYQQFVINKSLICLAFPTRVWNSIQAIMFLWLFSKTFSRSNWKLKSAESENVIKLWTGTFKSVFLNLEADRRFRPVSEKPNQGFSKNFLVKFGPSEKGTKLEKIFHLKFNATE